MFDELYYDSFNYTNNSIVDLKVTLRKMNIVIKKMKADLKDKKTNNFVLENHENLVNLKSIATEMKFIIENLEKSQQKLEDVYLKETDKDD